MSSTRRQVSRYRFTLAAGHPRANGAGYAYEHVILAERAIGNPLPAGAEVHHVDGNGKNNSPGNLVVCQDHAYHMLLHRRQRALDACGNPNAMKCRICKSYDRQEDITIYLAKGVTPEGRHRECMKLQSRIYNPRRFSQHRNFTAPRTSAAVV